MGNWKQQNEIVRAQIAACIAELQGAGAIWITCDTFDHLENQIIWMNEKVHPKELHLGHCILEDDDEDLMDVLLREWSKRVFHPSKYRVFHLKGLAYHTEEVYETGHEGYYDLLKRSAGLAEMDLGFTVVLWTKQSTRDLILQGAPTFCTGIRLFHLDSPPINIKRELDAIEGEIKKDGLTSEDMRDVGPYHSISRFRLLEYSTGPKDDLLIYDEMGIHFRFAMAYEDAVEIYERLLRLPASTLVPTKRAKYQVILGECYMEVEEDKKAALCFEEALHVARRVKDLEMQVDCLWRLGEIAVLQDREAVAISRLEEGLELALEYEDFDYQAEKIILALGTAYSMAERWKDAIAVYERFFEEELHLYNPPGDIHISSRLGRAIYNAGDKDAAMTTFQSIFERHPESKTAEGIQGAYLSMGMIHQERSEWEAAIEKFELATTAAIPHTDIITTCAAAISMTQVFTELGDAKNAVRHWMMSRLWQEAMTRDQGVVAEDDPVEILFADLVAKFGQEKVDELTLELNEEMENERLLDEDEDDLDEDDLDDDDFDDEEEQEDEAK